MWDVRYVNWASAGQKSLADCGLRTDCRCDWRCGCIKFACQLLSQDDAICWIHKVTWRNPNPGCAFQADLSLTLKSSVVSIHAGFARLLRIANMRPYIRHRRQHHRGGNLPSSTSVLLFRLTILLHMMGLLCFWRSSMHGSSPRPPPPILMDAVLGQERPKCASNGPQDEVFFILKIPW